MAISEMHTGKERASASSLVIDNHDRYLRPLVHYHAPANAVHRVRVGRRDFCPFLRLHQMATDTEHAFETRKAMATAYAQWIPATQSRSIFKMHRFELPNKPCLSVAVVQKASFEDIWLPFLRYILPSLFSFLSLLHISQSVLRASHFELFIRPSTPLPTASIFGGNFLRPNYCLLRPSHLDCGCLSLLASLCALPFSLPGSRCCCFGSCCCFCLLCCCFSCCFRCTSCLLCLCFFFGHIQR